MISLPFFSRPQAPSIDALYGMIVAQARSPSFYRGYGVPDTVEGRLDMIVLHLVLVLRALTGSLNRVHPLGQQVFDRFCQDIDHNFREMGVGDLAVPKVMWRVAEGFYGRAKVYESALAEEELDALISALTRNVYNAPTTPAGAWRLAAYVREASRQIGTARREDIERAKFAFPDPASVPAPQIQTGGNP